MKHPMINPSLAPFGYVMPISKERLHYEPVLSHYVNRECIVGKLWTQWNRVRASRPLPLETIIHEILPAQAQANRITEGDFWHNGKPYRERDILVLSTFVQWFGTNCGDCFLTTDISYRPRFVPEWEFLIKFKEEEKRGGGIIIRLIHECNDRCGEEPVPFFGDSHFYDSRSVGARDQALVDGLMRWLGRREGRAFIAEYVKRRDRKQAATRKREYRPVQAA